MVFDIFEVLQVGIAILLDDVVNIVGDLAFAEELFEFGGEPQVLDSIRTSPRFQDLWQLHTSNAAGEKNAPADFIANPQDPCEAKLLRVSAQRDGTFTITNTRNGFSKTYKP